MSNRNRVYTAILQQDVAINGGLGDCQFQINNNNRSFLLKSISFDIHIRQAIGQMLVLPLEQNVTQEFTFSLVALPVNFRFAQVFTNIVPPTTLIQNGNQIVMFHPGQLKFESFFISNVLLLALAYTNRDLLFVYNYIATIVIEIEDIEFVK